MRSLALSLVATCLLFSALSGTPGVAAGQSGAATAGKSNAGAALDPAFGDAGVLSLPPEGPEFEKPFLATAPSGDIILGGEPNLRLLSAATGGPASLYGRVGTLVPPQPDGGKFGPSALAVDSQGRLLVVGTSYFPTGNVSDESGYGQVVGPRAIRVIRYLPDGTLDPLFGTGGIVETDLGLGPPRRPGGEPIIEGTSVRATDVAIDSTGRIVITGGAMTGFGPSCTHDILFQYPVSAGLVVRLTEAGELDRGFGDEGIFGGRNLKENPLHAEVLGEPVVAPDGSITYLSTSQNPCDTRYGLAQLTADGQTRSSLGRAGAIRGYFTSLTGTSDGSVIALAGEGWSGREPYKARVIKIRPGGTRDRRFGHDGRTWVRLGHGAANELGSVKVDSQGRILLTGTMGGRNGRWMVLTRLSASGRKEQTFGPNGRISTPLRRLETISSVAVSGSTSALDPQGRLVFLHRYSVAEGSAPVLARYLLAG
jgi:uncharacterized delta-60 repeat protein